MCKMAFFVFSYFLTNLAFATAPYTCSDYLTDTKSLPIEVVLKQPVVAKFISSFNKITNTNDKSDPRAISRNHIET